MKWVIVELAHKREDFPHKNVPQLGKEISVKMDGDKAGGYLEEYKEKGVVIDYLFVWVGWKGRVDKFPLSNLKSFEWLDETINEPFDDGLFEGIYNKFCDYYEDDGSNEEQKRDNLKLLLSQIPYMICEYCCEHCGDPIEHPICRNCEIQLTLPDTEY